MRLGQAFWSRDPSLSSKFTANDFPTLQSQCTGSEDHASILQATMELTQLLHNTHDILYSSHARTQELILAGDYARYLDDFQKALLKWSGSWRTLRASPKIKSVRIDTSVRIPLPVCQCIRLPSHRHHKGTRSTKLNQKSAEHESAKGMSFSSRYYGHTRGSLRLRSSSCCKGGFNGYESSRS